MNATQFRYEVIAEDLRNRMDQGQYAVGSRLPTEPELAATYDVSRLTLRKALRLIEAEGLLDRRPRRGTVVLARQPAAASPAPAPVLPAGSQATILFLGQTQGHLRQDFFQALTRAAQASGRTVFPFDPTAANTPEGLRTVASLLAAGAPVLSNGVFGSDWAQRFPAAVTTPVYIGLLGELYPPVSGYQAAADHLRAGWLATQHLLQLGHRRIAFIGAHPQDDRPAETLPPVTREHPAYAGYRTALAEVRLTEERSLGCYGGVDRELVARYAQFLDRLGGWPTAFVCDADFRAVALQQALQARGLQVPRDVSLIGIGNTPWCSLVAGGLDSVALNEEELARLALSLSALPAPTESMVFNVKPRLVVRGSCVAPVAVAPTATKRSFTKKGT